MANQVAVDVEVAWPYIQKRLERYLAGASLGSGGASGGGTVGEHALDGPLHSGTLARAQAPWVATDIASAVASHALLPDVHHARQHGVLSSSDHTVTGSAWDVIGLSGTNTIGLLGSSSNPGVNERLLRTAADGSVNVVALISAQGSAGGGAIVQGLVDADTSYARAWFGHNAQWDATANIWNIDAIGANDAGGFYIPNGTPSIDIIFHPSTGTTGRTMAHADFIAGAKFRFSNTGRAAINSTDTSTYTLNVNGTVRASGVIYSGSDIEMTGELLAANGAVGAPSIAFLSDTDTGLYRSGTNAFSLVSGGTAIINVGATGAAVNAAFDSTAAFKVQSVANDDITLFLKQKSGQTARMWRVEDAVGQELIVLDSEGNLQSGNPGFTSGVRGWQVTPVGNAEFNNAWIRGELHASIFVMDEFHASGGTLVVAPAGKLENDATVNVTTGTTAVLDIRTTSASGSGSQLDIRTTSGTGSGTQITRRWIENYFEITDPPSGHATIFAVGDTLRCKSLGNTSPGIDLYDVWATVTRIEDMTDYYRYYYTRQSGGSDGIVIPAGAAVISYGAQGDGRILLTADQNYAPYIDIFTSGASPWAGDITPHTRLGRLDGVGLPGVSGIEQYGMVTSTDLSDASAPYIVNSNLQMFSYNVDSEWNNGNPTARVTSGGEFRLGTDVDADSTTGLLFNPTTGALTIGSASYPGTVTVYGSITVTGGNAAKTDFSNITATIDAVPDGSTYFKTTANQVTGAGRAYTAINSSNNLVTSVIPATAVTPGGAGLFLGSNYMGYHNGTDWKTYTDSSGNWKLLGSASNNYIQWVAASNKLQGVGGGVEQWYADATDGKLKAGAGTIVIDSAGLKVANGSAAGITFYRTNTFTDSNKSGRLWALSDLSPARVYMSAGRSIANDGDSTNAAGTADITAYNSNGNVTANLSVLGNTSAISMTGYTNAGATSGAIGLTSTTASIASYSGGSVTSGITFTGSTGTAGFTGDLDMNGNDIIDIGSIGDVGSWTPAITFGGGSTGLTYTARGGRYIKVGKMVFASAYIFLSAKGSSTGAAKISGLPATHASTINSIATVVWYQMASNFVYMAGMVDTSATTISLVGHTAASASYTALTHADFANNSIIQMTVMYESS